MNSTSQSEIYLIRDKESQIPIYVGQHTHNKCAKNCSYWSSGKLIKLSYLTSSGESKECFTKEILFRDYYSPDELDLLEITSIEKYGTLFPNGRNLTKGGSANQKASFSKRFCIDCSSSTTHIGDICFSCLNKSAFNYKHCDQCSRTTAHKSNVGCWACFRSSNYKSIYCQRCDKLTAHSSGNRCFTCVNNDRLYSKYCLTCAKDQTHSGEKCYGCARRRSYQIIFCAECKKATNHLGKNCINCKRGSVYRKSYCGDCGKETTFSGNTCLSCRAITRKNCIQCSKITKHKRGMCLEDHDSKEEVGA